MISDVPGPEPVYAPVPAMMVAAAVLLLLHVPPVVASAKLAEAPVHTEVGPVMADKGLTVTTVVTVHPPGAV